MTPPLGTRPGLIGFRISPINAEGVDWPRLKATWELAAELGVFDAGWMSDHLTDASRDRGGGGFEAMTSITALASLVPGLWVGVAVLSNTFRHPAVVAKAATILDNVTGGRFICGIGAGWHEGEHDQFGITLPPPPERFDRFESAVRVLAALFSEEARQPPGVTLDDPFYPLRGATNEPGSVRPEGPPIWVGAGKPRGIRLLARYGDGWPMPGNRAGDVGYFVEKRDEIRRALEAAGRDPATFTIGSQLSCGTAPAELRAARETALAFKKAGADHIILGLAGPSAPTGLADLAREVAQPLRDAAG